MRFDAEIARGILIAIEATPANHHPEDVELAGVDDAVIYEHLEILHDAGLLEARFMKSGMGNERYLHVQVVRLTHSGHQFLASARNESVWKRTMAFVLDKGGSVTIDVLTQLLAKYSSAHFGLTP